jgi:3-phenylpropionate/cinnamic acid dioxygenase small subunit
MTDNNAASSRDSKLEALLARQEIHDVLVRYCAGIDRGDLKLILSAFHEDARDNHTGVEETAVERFTRTVVEGASMWTSHNLSNILIEVDGSSANAQSCFTAWHRFDIQKITHDWVIAGRYLDRFERRNGDWRIFHRTVLYDCERYDEVAARPDGHPALLDHALRGSRSRNDYFYQLFRFP